MLLWICRATFIQGPQGTLQIHINVTPVWLLGKKKIVQWLCVSLHSGPLETACNQQCSKRQALLLALRPGLEPGRQLGSVKTGAFWISFKRNPKPDHEDSSKTFYELCVCFSVPQCFLGLQLQCGIEMSKWATTTLTPELESAQLQQAQSSAWTGAAVFSGKGAVAPRSAPLQCREVQTSWSQLQGPLCWHPLCGTHIPRATCCRPQRKPVPGLEIQLPALRVQMNALKARSSFLLQFWRSSK